MEEILTVTEIRARFLAEWILVGDPEVGPDLEVLRGAILSHSADRDEVYRAAVTLKPKRSAVLYTGSLAKDQAIILCLFDSTLPKG